MQSLVITRCMLTFPSLRNARPDFERIRIDCGDGCPLPALALQFGGWVLACADMKGGRLDSPADPIFLTTCEPREQEWLISLQIHPGNERR